MSLKAFETEADQVDDFADASAFVGASECAAKLLDEAALSEEAKVELNRFMVSNPTKNLLRFFPIVRKLDEFVLSGACELALTSSATPSRS